MENNASNSLEISRSFEVSKDQLYSSWTDPEALKTWWKPEDLRLEKVETKIENNGDLLYLFKNNAGKEVKVTGKYQEVAPGEKLVYSWNWQLPEDKVEDSNFTLTICFRADGNKSILEVRQEGFSSEESASNHREAWEKGLADLQRYLSGAHTLSGEQATYPSCSVPGAAGINNENKVTGYNELEDQEKVGGYS